MSEFNRRSFIKTTGLVAGGIPLFSSCLSKPLAYRVFTEEEARCIIALCEQIIPRDDFPGATDAGVIHYIDRQLASVFRHNQANYREGIIKLQAYCSDKYESLFEDLDAEAQTGIMKQMEANRMDESEWAGRRPALFFSMVRNHTMQGFYGSPIHGGNRDYMSFRMMDFEYPLVIGQNRYRTKGEDL